MEISHSPWGSLDLYPDRGLVIIWSRVFTMQMVGRVLNSVNSIVDDITKGSILFAEMKDEITITI